MLFDKIPNCRELCFEDLVFTSFIEAMKLSFTLLSIEKLTLIRVDMAEYPVIPCIPNLKSLTISNLMETHYLAISKHFFNRFPNLEELNLHQHILSFDFISLINSKVKKCKLQTERIGGAKAIVYDTFEHEVICKDPITYALERRLYPRSIVVDDSDLGLSKLFITAEY